MSSTTKRQRKQECDYPTGPRTITLRDLDEETWFHLLATIEARADYFKGRLAEAVRLADPLPILDHYQWAIKMHQQIAQDMRQQIGIARRLPAKFS